MNAKEIDELFDAIFANDLNKLCQMANIKVIDEDIEEFLLVDDNGNKIFRILMTKIEQGDYDYFYSKIYDDMYKDVVVGMLAYSTQKRENLRKIIENNDKLGINNVTLMYIIKATGDSEYIKEIIEDKAVELGLLPSEIIELIEATEDPEYIKGIIEDKAVELGLHPSEIIKLIEATEDPEYIKGIIDNKDKREELRLDNRDELTRLIKATGDSEYIKGIIEDKDKREEFGLFSLVKLIEATGDPEYIKGIIEDKDKRKKLIFNDSDELMRLIIAIGDSEYIKRILEDKDKLEELRLFPYQKMELIIATGDSEYIKRILEDKDKLKELSLHRYQKMKLIKATEDPEYIKGIIDNKDKVAELSLSPFQIVELIGATGDSEYVNDYLNKNIILNVINTNQQIKLPNTLTIGLEIESEGEYSQLIKQYYKFEDGWKSKDDGSLSSGVEVVSPILKGNHEQSSESIKKVCEILKGLRTECIK